MNAGHARCAALVGIVGILAGCGGGDSHRRRAGAEPAVAPAPATAPAGRTVRVGSATEGIVADAHSGMVAVAVRDPPRIIVLDARSGRVVRRVRIAGPARHLQLSTPGGGPATVLVPEAPIDRLLELPLARGGAAPRSIAVGSLPHDATADDGRVFVADEFGRAVSVVAGAHVVGRIGGFVQPGGIAAAGKDVAVVDVGADMVTLIDAGTLRVVGRAPAGAGPTHVVAGADGRLYVIDTRGNALLVYATRPRLSLVHRIGLPGTPYGVAIDPLRDRLWVTETATDRVAEFDTRAAMPRLVRSFPTGRQPNTVAVDPANGRVFVADAAAAMVQFFDPAQVGSLR